MKKILAAACAVHLGMIATASHAATTGFDQLADWNLATSGVTVETFESLSLGAISSIGTDITSVSGSSVNGTAQTQVDQPPLPFTMFTDPLPSGTKFLSNGLSAAEGFSSGSMSFVFGTAVNAVGAVIADSAPLDDFMIEIFSGGSSLGSITVGPRNLGTNGAFVGITSDAAFDTAIFSGVNANDSWGLDDLSWGGLAGTTPAVPLPAGLPLLAAGLVGLGLLRRKA